MSLRIRRWFAAIDSRIPLLDHGPNRSIYDGSTAGKGDVRKALADSRGKARGKSLGPVSMHVCAWLRITSGATKSIVGSRDRVSASIVSLVAATVPRSA